jgi:hypothetical protein
MYLNRSNGSLGPAQLEGVEIRFASSADAAELERLRQLDSSSPLDGAGLVATVDGQLLAAISTSGKVIADPFRRTAEIVELLRLRARQLGEHELPGQEETFVGRSRRTALSLRLRQAAR